MTEDVIQKLKNEVKKQIQKKQLEREKDKENRQVENKSVKHHTSVMPYEMR